MRAQASPRLRRRGHAARDGGAPQSQRCRVLLVARAPLQRVSLQRVLRWLRNGTGTQLNGTVNAFGLLSPRISDQTIREVNVFSATPNSMSHTSDLALRGVHSAGRTLRDGWLMMGVMLLMLAGLEGAYRVQAVLRHLVHPSIPALHPYADSSWYPAYLREYEATFGLRWKPYVYFRRPFYAGVYINVDSLGHRRTVPGPISASDTVHIFCFGGSTMFGSFLRDSATIASVIARRLAGHVAPGAAIDVTNYGESGYVFTQEMLELELQLRANNVPDIVVFYDGINDVAAAAQYGKAGVPQNEGNRAREFAFGRAIYGSETGVGSDARAAVAIGSAMAQRFQFLERLREAVARPAVPAGSSA